MKLNKETKDKIIHVLVVIIGLIIVIYLIFITSLIFISFEYFSDNFDTIFLMSIPIFVLMIICDLTNRRRNKYNH